MALAGELLAQQSYDFNLLCRYCLKKTSELNKIFDHGLNTAKYCSDSSKPSHGASSAEIEDVPLHMALIECTQIEVIARQRFCCVSDFNPSSICSLFSRSPKTKKCPGTSAPDARANCAERLPSSRCVRKAMRYSANI